MPRLTDAQVEHLWSAIAEFQKLAKPKYEAGAAEHGGNLWDHPPLWHIEQAMLECLDLWFYLKDARDKLRAIDRVIIEAEGPTKEANGAVTVTLYATTKTIPEGNAS